MTSWGLAQERVSRCTVSQGLCELRCRAPRQEEDPKAHCAQDHPENGEDSATAAEPYYTEQNGSEAHRPAPDGANCKEECEGAETKSETHDSRPTLVGRCGWSRIAS